MSVFRSCFFYWHGSSVERLVFERLIDISLRHRFCYTIIIIVSEKFLMHITKTSLTLRYLAVYVCRREVESDFL